MEPIDLATIRFPKFTVFVRLDLKCYITISYVYAICSIFGNNKILKMSFLKECLFI